MKGWRQLQEIQSEERRAKGRMRILWARASAELRKVASGSATQGLWLRNRKVRSQVSGADRSQLPRRKTVRELGEEKDGEEEPATKRRRE